MGRKFSTSPLYFTKLPTKAIIVIFGCLICIAVTLVWHLPIGEASDHVVLSVKEMIRSLYYFWTSVFRYNWVMAWLSVGFMLVSWLLTRLLGSVGFILANCCNMAARITHSVLFIKRRYQNTCFTPLDGLYPRPMFLTASLASAAITLASEAYFYESCKLAHFGVGTTCLAGVLGIWYFENRDVVSFGVERLRRQSLKAD